LKVLYDDLMNAHAHARTRARAHTHTHTHIHTHMIKTSNENCVVIESIIKPSTVNSN